MSFVIHPSGVPAPFARSIAIAALVAVTMLAGSTSAARADNNATNGVIQLAQAAAPQIRASRGATEGKGETVEQRIATLHSALKIVPSQEPLWNAVAQAMRENAAAIDTLVAETRATSPQSRTAVEDLTMYQKFAQAHVDGLQNLITSFVTLYNAMPDTQKKVADEVFRSPGSKGARSNG
jgi:hypothetical protein